MSKASAAVATEQNVDVSADRQADSRASHTTERSSSDEVAATTDGLDDTSTRRSSLEAHWRDTTSERLWEQTEDGRQDLDGHFASTDLLNPADALHLLAQVADLESDEQPDIDGSTGRGATATNHSRGSGAAQTDAYQYPPISDGHLTFSDASYLIRQ